MVGILARGPADCNTRPSPDHPFRRILLNLPEAVLQASYAVGPRLDHMSAWDGATRLTICR